MKRFITQESGAALVFVCISLPLILLLLALVIDMDAGRLTANRLQIAADASALAGASELSDPPNVANVNAKALEFSRINYSTALAGSAVLTTQDIHIGNWNQGTRVFTRASDGGSPINAVQTTTRRDSVNNNPLQAIFGSIAGFESYDIAKTAVAVNGAGVRFPCIGGGILSLDFFESQSDAEFSSFCIYGRRFVESQQNNIYTAGTIVASAPAPEGQGYVGDSEEGFDDIENQVSRQTFELPTLDNLEQFAQDARAGQVPSDIDFLDNATLNVPQKISGDVTISSVTPNTLYIVEGKATIEPSSAGLSNFAVVADSFDIKKGGTIDNAVFIADQEKISVESDAVLGDPDDPCNAGPGGNGQFGVYLFQASREKELEIGSNVSLNGVQAAANQKLIIQSTTETGSAGFYAEARGEATVQSNGNFRGCEQGLTSGFGPITSASVAAGNQRLVLVD